MNSYFSTFIPGTGEIIKQILPTKLENLEISLSLDGLIVYRTSSSISTIQKLRFFNNSFGLVKQFNNITEDPLTEISKQILKINFDQHQFSQFLPSISSSFRIVTQVANQGTKLNKLILEKLEQKLSSLTNLPVNRTNPDLEFWIYCRSEGDCFFAVRLTKHPTTIKSLQPGQLRPELANILCLLSDPQPEDIVLDPFAGSGAIPLKRTNFPFTKIIASDIEINPSLRAAERGNLLVIQANSTNLTFLEDHSISKIITDPPWGLFDPTISLPKLYLGMLEEFSRILKPTGQIVLLSVRNQLFDEILAKQPQFNQIQKHNILVSGQKATIYRLLHPS